MRMTSVMAIVTASLALVAATTGPLRAEDEVAEAVTLELAPEDHPAEDGTMWAGGSPDFCEACDGEVIDTEVDPNDGAVSENPEIAYATGADDDTSVELGDPMEGVEGIDPEVMYVTGGDWVKRSAEKPAAMATAPSRGEETRLSTEPGRCDLSRDLLSCLLNH